MATTTDPVQQLPRWKQRTSPAPAVPVVPLQGILSGEHLHRCSVFAEQIRKGWQPTAEDVQNALAYAVGATDEVPW